MTATSVKERPIQEILIAIDGFRFISTNKTPSMLMPVSYHLARYIENERQINSTKGSRYDGSTSTTRRTLLLKSACTTIFPSPIQSCMSIQSSPSMTYFPSPLLQDIRNISPIESAINGCNPTQQPHQSHPKPLPRAKRFKTPQDEYS